LSENVANQGSLAKSCIIVPDQFGLLILVRGLPELFLETEMGTVAVVLGLLAAHTVLSCSGGWFLDV
jgi:hypothetical protein